MNWKPLLIGLSLVVGILARPADETSSEKERTTTAITLAAETTILTEKPVTEALIATTVATKLLNTPDAPTTVRYLHPTNLNQQTKPTNSRSKYANNYANLITKHTLNKQKFVNNTKNNSSITLDNLSFNITSGGNFNQNNKIANENALSSATSNSSSRPLVFVDADHVTTTRRAFIALNGNINHGTWSNYNLEETGTYPTIKKKPVIHKIISKWSDNPHEVFNLHAASNQEPFISSQQAQITEITNQLVQNSFNNRIPLPTLNNEVLPITLGQQLLHEEQHMSSTRRPVIKTSSRKPIIITSTVNNLLDVKKKKPTKPQFSKNRCLIKIGNRVITNYDECKQYQVNDKIDSNLVSSSFQEDYSNKFEDEPTGFQVDIEPDEPSPPGIPPGVPPSFPSEIPPIGDIPSARPSNASPESNGGDKIKYKKRKNKKQTQTDTDNTDVGSMVMTMMTMMAIFNPLNFGVWGIIMAPMAAMLLGGACFAMYHYMNTQTKTTAWQPHSHGWHNPHEIVIKNRIKHSPIPIKIMHMHKHSQTGHSSPIHEYSPPWHNGDMVKSFGEPPLDYHPSAPSGGGPYTRRKTNMRQRVRRPVKNPFIFKLL
jgi:hypothetical protein